MTFVRLEAHHDRREFHRHLIRMTAQNEQENIALDYKASDSLQNTEGKQNEISKDVSAFANSAGGVIV